jgi:recombination protein RecT
MNELTVIKQQFEPLLPRLEDALGAAVAHLPVPRLMQTIYFSIEQNPRLIEANRQTLFNAALTFAFLGLEVDGATGQGYLIPFNKRVQPVIGYKGYATLGARSGLTITGDVVRDGDLFEFDLGSAPFVRHRPKLGDTGRKIIGAYACASSHSRPPIVAVIGIDELMAIKKRSPGGAKPDSPWNDPLIGFPAMCAKTAKRRLARGMPLNVFQHAARLEEAFEEAGLTGYIDPTRGVVVEADPTPPPTSTMLTQSPPPETGAVYQPDTVEAPAEPAHARAQAPPDVSGDLGRFRVACSAVADEGTKKLLALWNTIPFEFRANLQSTFDKQWWPRALLADRRSDEKETLL